MNQYEQTRRQTPSRPQSDLDLNLMLTNPVYGTDAISETIQKKLRKGFLLTDADGKPIVDQEGNHRYDVDSMWEKLNFYTRDMRLGNLGTKEITYCQWYIDFVSDLLQDDMYESAIVALTRAATIIELSQSKNGFLRKQPNTLRTEHIAGELEPERRGILRKREN